MLGSANGAAVLFGGYIGTTFLNDTWLWDGASWSQAQPASAPSPRRYYAASGLGGTMLLFGGANASTVLGDTWVWNGSTWSEKFPASHPSARRGAAITLR